MYSICIGLIVLSLFVLRPNVDYTLSIVTLLIAGAYLFAEIKIILKKLLPTIPIRNYSFG
jgi:hypothetical protein